MSLLDSLVAVTLPITPRFVVGRVARRYIAGETVADAVATIRSLNAAGADCTVDVLGEFISEFGAAEKTAGDYREMLDAIEHEGLRSGISIKLTAIGLSIDEARCEKLVRGLVSRAAEMGSFVRIDMEDSPVTDQTLAFVRRLVADGLPVGAVLQAYLHRTVDDAQQLAEEGVSVRLCKGIYKEPESIAFQDREAVRDSYRRALEALLNGTGNVGIATHDEILVQGAGQLVKQLNVPKDRYEYQMLLGVRTWLRDQLINAGERVRIYVPFGADWYGYSTRRLQENPEIAGHVFKAMLGFK